MLRKKSVDVRSAPCRPATLSSRAIGTTGPERLVGVGFRCWMAGYRTGDIACWELAWTDYSNALGPRDAKCALGELACWVRAVKDTARREIEVYPAGCVGFCRDECLAISMIAAAQHSACPAMRACAYTLLGTSQIDEVVATSGSFAAVLAGVEQKLAAGAVGNVLMLAGEQPGAAWH